MMILNWRKSESGVYPELVDNSSSNYVTYLRKNIVEKQVTDEESGELHTVYEYDETKLTKEQYAEYIKHPELWMMDEYNAEVTKLRKENIELQSQVNLLTGCILEMSEVLYM